MIKIAIIKNIPIYSNPIICFISHSKNEIFLGRFFYKLSTQNQNILIDKHINEIKNIHINLSYIEKRKCLQEMYNILRENKNNDSSVFEDMQNISNEYISLQKELKN